MKKTMFLFVLALLIFTGCSDGSIKIGFIGPLTGDAANYGKLMTQAVKIAVEEKNAAGGIGGKKISFVAEDSEGKPDKATTAIEKLISIDKVQGIIGCVFSSCSLAVAPRAEAEKVVLISPSSTHKDLPDKGDYIFRTVFSDALQSQVFAKYVYQKMGIRKIAILHIKNDYSQGLATDFAAQFEAEGGEIVATESGLPNDKDFKTQLTKIKATEPEALFMPNYVPEIAQILEQASQLGLDAQMLSADGFSNPDIFDLAPEYASDVVFSKPEIGGEKTAAFEKAYQEKWGEKPDSFSLNAYDGAMILLDAISKAIDKKGNIDKKKLRDSIAQVKNYHGVSGNITFMDNGDVVKNIGISKSTNSEYRQLGVYKIQNGQLLEVE